MNSNRSLIRGLILGSAVYLTIITILSLLLGRQDLTIGIILGGVLAILNFKAMEWVVAILVQVDDENEPSQNKSKSVLAKLLIKGFGIFIAIGVALWVAKIDPIGLTLGLSAVVAAIMLYAIWLAISGLGGQEGPDENE